MIFLLLACAAHWTEENALAPTLAHLDRDGDGRVEVAEYEAVALRGTPFAEADADGDGALSVSELAALAAGEDPALLSHALKGPPKNGHRRAGNESGKRPLNKTADGKQAAPKAGDHNLDSGWAVRMVLESLRDEVRYADPNAALPTDDAIGAAASSGHLHTAETRVLLRELETLSDTAKIAFPPSLREAALATEEVVPAAPPLPEPEPPGPGREPPRMRPAQGAGPAPK